jgi:phosphomannomutase/phosphoglucomutase
MFFRDRYFGYDDGIYAGARLLELVAREGRTPEELLADLSPACNTPELRLACGDDVKFRIADGVRDHFRAGGAEVIDVDGVRVRFPHGWGLLRASNTQPALVMRFEAETPEQLDQYRGAVESAVAAVRARLGG